MNWFMNDDFDRYDLAFTLVLDLIAAGILILGAPLWTFAVICLIGGTIVMYRHLPLPPRRIKHR
jgi:hypothetical protein